MTAPCNTADGCGLAFSDDHGRLRADAVISPATCNTLGCIPGTEPFPGLFAAQDQSLNQAGISHGWGGAIDISTYPEGFAQLVDYSGDFTVPNTITNESDCLTQNVISVVTSREFQFDGPAGAHFRISIQEKIDGIGFFPLVRIEVDLRSTQLAITPIQEARPIGCAAGGRAIPPGGTLTYQYRTYLTMFQNGGPGSLVNSPGFTWAYLTATN